MLCQGRCPQPTEAGHQLLQPLHIHVRPQQAPLAAQRARRASMYPQVQASSCLLVHHAQRHALEVQRQLQRPGECILHDVT